MRSYIDLIEHYSEDFDFFSDVTGYWITSEGDVLECDYDNDRHHANLAMDYFKMPEDGEPNDAATRAGWIRVLDSRNEIAVELNPIKATEKALRQALRLIRPDVGYYVLDLDPQGHYISKNSNDFKTYIRRTIDKHRSV